MTNNYGLGRLIKEDPRDSEYRYSNVLKARTTNKRDSTIKVKHWEQSAWWGNQGSRPMCVGFAWRHWLMDAPVLQDKKTIWATRIYKQAQRKDAFPGTNYEGTTIRAGAKVLKGLGYISSYTWAHTVDEIVDAVIMDSPVVVGTQWYGSMSKPNKKGIIKPKGKPAGGHAYLINGVDLNRGLFRIKNSWGQSWGKGGNAYISISDFETLLSSRHSEVCIAVENSK